MQDLTFNVPESWGGTPPKVEHDIRKLWPATRGTRKNQVRLRKRRNKTWRWLRLKLSQQRRGKNTFYVQLHAYSWAAFYATGVNRSR